VGITTRPVEIILLFFLILVISGIVGSIRRARRMREEQERYEEELRRRQQDPDAPQDPLAGSPFGSLFESLFSGSGMMRSYTYDPETGEWVDISNQRPEPEPEPEHAETNGEKPRRAQKQRRRRQSQSSMFSPFGMMGGDGSGDFEVEPPDELIRFDDVGGMDELKREVRDTVGLLLQHPDEAERYGIEWNGILLHGPPGVGKTFFARAIAGEYGLNLIHVSTGDLVSSLVGGSARNIDKAFDTALDNLPCLLFFDEFDSVAQRREGTPDQESRRTVNQLLTALEAHRDERRLLVMAATNSIQHLDPAVVRPGRFDRHIRIDLPDAEARRAIFATELEERPVGAVDLDELVRRTEGMTPAAIEKVVDMAALDVFKQASETGRSVELDTEHLLSALERVGGQDRPTVEHWTWDSLVLDETIKAQLRQLQAVIEDPESARRFGVEPPTGLLLAGPPGTGKTTIAKVLAAQARASFYPVSGADVMSKWVGESEQNIRRLFERARENRPSIIFIDEIDAIAGRRGAIDVHDSQINQLLAEIDGIAGQRGVFLIGATNRPDQLDPALLRGGRLSRTVVLGLPDEEGRRKILALHTARMPTVGVRFDELARVTDGMSPADLKALAQEAAMAAMARDGSAETPAVTHEDFEEALERLRGGSVAAPAPF
jgi:transitional endoplasmic reticulum ATPase